MSRAVEEITVGHEMVGIVNDPLTAAVCSFDEIRRMMEKMFEDKKDALPMFY